MNDYNNNNGSLLKNMTKNTKSRLHNEMNSLQLKNIFKKCYLYYIAKLYFKINLFTKDWGECLIRSFYLHEKIL